MNSDQLGNAVPELHSETPPMRDGKLTLAEELRLQLADDIVTGTLEPGAALDETELARRFGVSRTPCARRSASSPPAALSRRARIAARWWRGPTPITSLACSR